MSIGKYIVRTVAAVVALYAIFFGFAVILAIFDGVTWDDVWLMSGKVGLVALVLLALNIVLAGLVGMLPHSSEGKKK